MDKQSTTPSFDRDRWLSILEKMSGALSKDGSPVELCLIGSAACLFAGMELRTTEDLDIWQPSSDFDLIELKKAAEESGLSFNPKQILSPDLPYLQLLDPGIVQVGEFLPVRMFKIGRLIISRPPIENLIASKLTRAAPKDIQDIQFLHQHFRPDLAKIKNIVSEFPSSARDTATENLVYLEILK
jgi:hypothetical protein